ncbi:MULTISPECIES: phosphoribosyltransferase [unclassified Sphingomonas]|jgi:uncharacterized protein|uniref:phosphoribosyltransferase n=1 Tax=unclassified Sphingomonas TaxID=196159 RepID=UPI000E1099CB|nr:MULTISPECIES: phosphoribosyltransferase domain-containing protein [unclassified Sphingomonas]AXJ95526.1 phosphoribosyltransferase [Sphingomonas sp. FARSPH]
MPVFTVIPHDDFVADVRTLAAAVAGDAEWRPDHIVGIGRGGLVPAVYLSHAIGVPTVSCDQSSGIDGLVDTVLVRVAGWAAAGRRLLFVDDINDSGRTIAGLRATLAEAGAPAANVRFATLIDNAVSTVRVDYRARTIDRRVTKDWFVFPWEAVASEDAIAHDAAEVPDRIA